MNKKVYDLLYQLNIVFSKKEYENLFTFASVGEFFLNLSQNFKNHKIEVVIDENDYRLFSSKIFLPLKEKEIKINYYLVESSNLTNNIKDLEFDGEADAIVVVGNDRIFSKVKSLPCGDKACYLVPTSPYIENLFHYSKGKNFFSIIDLELLERAKSDSFSESYMAVMNKLTTLIDYKINSFVNASEIDGLLFDRVKSAINTVAVLPTFANYKRAIIGAQITLAITNVNGDLLGFGADTVVNALSFVAQNLSYGAMQALAFEKTCKLYHMFFYHYLTNLNHTYLLKNHLFHSLKIASQYQVA